MHLLVRVLIVDDDREIRDGCASSSRTHRTIGSYRLPQAL
jgi:hypothetical protein